MVDQLKARKRAFTKDVVTKFLDDYLPINRRENFKNHIQFRHINYTDEPEYLQDVDIACQNLLILAGEMKDFVLDKHKEKFLDIATRIGNISKGGETSGLYPAFRRVCDELFAEEVNWSHITAFLLVAAEAQSHSRLDICQPSLGRKIRREYIDFVSDYLNDKCLSWIDSQGGWSSLNTLVDLGAQGTLKSMRSYMSIAVLAACVAGFFISKYTGN